MADARYFTVEEANALVPQLELRFSTVLRMRTQLRAAHDELHRLGEPPTADTIVRSSGSDGLKRARGRFRALLEAMTEELQAVEAAGVTIKDLDTGLCDFLGRLDGRDVWLCWQYGEKRVAFYHEIDAGFAGRQPLEAAAGDAPPRVVH